MVELQRAVVQKKFCQTAHTSQRSDMGPLSCDRITDRVCKVVVVGLGYVGLPVAIRASEVGFQVTGFDLDSSKVKLLQSGQSYVPDVTNSRLRSVFAESLSLSDDPSSLGDFDIAIITVPTPLKGGLPDLSFVEAAGKALSHHLKPGRCVVLESTSYPGTTEELLGPILCSGSGLSQGEFFLGFSPERVDPGNVVFTLENTPKLVAGVDSESLKIISCFYKALVSEVHQLGSCAEAEMAKLLENTFRHVNIALVNELARYAHELSIDIWSVIEAAKTKPFGFMSFTPGPGVGGHCLPIDPSYLSWKVRNNLGRSFRFVDLANDVNEHMPEYVVERVQRLLNSVGKPLKGSRVCLLGMAYKAGTGDWRESPSVQVLRGLVSQGCRVTVCDPHVREVENNFDGRLSEFSRHLLRSSDLSVILVSHGEFDRDLICEESALVLDTQNFLRGLTFVGERL
jgi:nucleotide sugar dehydrogenase